MNISRREALKGMGALTLGTRFGDTPSAQTALEVRDVSLAAL
jgi:hypothetical protein